MPDGVTVARQVLVLKIGVRFPVRQPSHALEKIYKIYFEHSPRLVLMKTPRLENLEEFEKILSNYQISPEGKELLDNTPPWFF